MEAIGASPGNSHGFSEHLIHKNSLGGVFPNNSLIVSPSLANAVNDNVASADIELLIRRVRPKAIYYDQFGERTQIDSAMTKPVGEYTPGRFRQNLFLCHASDPPTTLKKFFWEWLSFDT
jgi:hypothetical protein